MAERNRRIRVNIQFSVCIQGFAVSQKRRRVTLPSTGFALRRGSTGLSRGERTSLKRHETTNAVATFRHATSTRTEFPIRRRSTVCTHADTVPLLSHLHTRPDTHEILRVLKETGGPGSVCAFVFHSQWFYLDANEHRTGDTALCETAVRRSVLRTSKKAPTHS